MFRFEVGARILVRKYDWEGEEQIEVEILDKAPTMIKVRVLSQGWFHIGNIGDICWLSDKEWFAVCRIKPANERTGQKKKEMYNAFLS